MPSRWTRSPSYAQPLSGRTTAAGRPEPPGGRSAFRVDVRESRRPGESASGEGSEHGRRLSGSVLRRCDVLHVGDNPVDDVVAAQRAGLDTVWINRDRLEWTHDKAPSMAAADLRELTLRLTSR
ncbi:HAD family hydrolase [Microbispora rosea]|uniref:HAD family hydrolase n=1 Tax=Microbispora rosea TaxID=58117 RepID=UPI00341526B1